MTEHTDALPDHVTPIRKQGKITAYKYQRRVPKDVQPFFKNITKWDLYLGSNLTSALIRAGQKTAEHDALIALYRDPKRRSRKMMDELMDIGATRIAAATRSADPKPQSPGWQNTSEILETCSTLPRELEHQALAVFMATAFGDTAHVDTQDLPPFFDELAKIQPAPPPSNRSEQTVFKALKTALAERLSELDATKTVPVEERLSGRMEQYINFNPLAEKTAVAYRTRIKRFIHFLGDDRALTAITDDDIRRYRDFLRAGCDDYLPMEVSGVQQYISVLNALFNWAIDEKKATENPAARVRSLRNTKSVEETRWVAFSSEDMARIWPALQQAWGPNGKSRLSQERRVVFLAVFRLLLWTGMRPNEVFKLDPEKVGRDRIHIIKTKTAAARTLPLTAANAEFYDLIRSEVWTKALSNEKGSGLKKDLQKTMSEAFTDIVRGLGISDERKVLYSTKDTMLNALEALGVSENTQRTIIGHKTGRGALRNYKEPAQLEAMRIALEQLDFCPGLP